jgi:hypothetical protein
MKLAKAAKAIPAQIRIVSTPAVVCGGLFQLAAPRAIKKPPQ